MAKKPLHPCNKCKIKLTRERWCEDCRKEGGWSGNRGTTTQRGYGAAWRKLRVAVMDRDGWMCQPCVEQGHVTKATAVDHIIPKSRGGTDDLENLQAICDPCHTNKTAREGKDARAW